MRSAFFNLCFWKGFCAFNAKKPPDKIERQSVLSLVVPLVFAVIGFAKSCGKGGVKVIYIKVRCIAE